MQMSLTVSILLPLKYFRITMEACTMHSFLYQKIQEPALLSVTQACTCSDLSTVYSQLILISVLASTEVYLHTSIQFALLKCI